MVLAGMLLAGRPCAFALNPALDVSQYAHTAWKIREGFAKGYIASIAQTPDGYLWLGTEFGLLRFDGVRNVPWQPPPGQHLPSSDITRLLVARDGTLWIGTFKGLASWKNGKLTQYPELAGQFVSALLEDREGTVWAGGMAFPPHGRLCAIQSGSVQCYEEDGRFGRAVISLYEDSKGSLWVGVLTGLWRWRPGPPKFYSLPVEPDGIQGLAEDAGGTLLIGTHGGIRRFLDGKAEAYRLPATVQRSPAYRLLRDHDGGLWIGTTDRGLVHVHQGSTDIFTPSDGLTGEEVYMLFEDREGSIWVATINGLDRFRDFAVTTFSVNQGLSNALVWSVLADRDGSVWLGTGGGLKRWNNGQFAIPRTGSVKRDGKLNGLAPVSLFQDDRGRIWISTMAGVGYLENDRFVPINGVPKGFVNGITEDRAGNIWIANQDLGLFRLSARSEVQQIPWDTLGHKDNASALAADPVLGGLWLGFFGGGITYFRDGEVRAAFAAADGLGEGTVNRFRFDQDGTVWAATEGGLSRLKNGRVAALTSKNGLPCDAVHWVIRDNDHSFWLYMPCGLVRVARSELDAWAAAADKDKDTKRTIHATVFDSSDGLRSRAYAGGSTPHVARSADGKLWFGAYDGVSVVDPHHVPFNRLPPPVHIEQITADHKTYDVSSVEAPLRARPEPVRPSAANGPERSEGAQGELSEGAASPDGARLKPASTAGLYNGRLRLPPLVRDLEIDYTALSLVAPEKVLFRYKLEGWDRDWQDAGIRRQAFYTNLPPRNYRFHVMACNNSGVWNEAGAFLDFSVAPAYHQTFWFRLLCVVASALLLWTAYRLRVHSIQQRAQELASMNAKLEAEIAERKQAEEALSRTQAELARATRVTTMGELTASLAHEVNQPIAAAITNSKTGLRWLTRDPPDVGEAREAFSRIAKDATRAADIVKRIRSMFKKSTAQREPVDVNEVIRDVIVLLRNEAYRHSVSIREHLATDFPKVMADRVQLQQVLTNLMLNGIEAMKDVDAARELTVKSEQADGSQLLISVSDTGVGLAPEQADQIFKAFFTTKPDGTGMGLSISGSIIESHGGRLWATANAGRGATFQFTLPIDSGT